MRIVLGVSKKFCQYSNEQFGNGESLRVYLSESEILLISSLLKDDEGLYSAGYDHKVVLPLRKKMRKFRKLLYKGKMIF